MTADLFEALARVRNEQNISEDRDSRFAKDIDMICAYAEDRYRPVRRLELLTNIASKTKVTDDLLQYILDLYGREFIRANDEIARLKSANDELFRLKQKVVIVNRGLIQKNHELEEAAAGRTVQP